MRGRLSFALCALWLSLLFAAPAAAGHCEDGTASAGAEAEILHFGIFSTIPGNPHALALDGEVGLDTFRDFHCALAKRPDLRLIVLNSNGGMVDPALEVAYEVRRRGIATYIPEQSECYSSCSFIFLAGEQRAARGVLGVHSLLYDRQGAASARVVRALSEFGTNRAVISVMMRTPPFDVFVFNSHMLASLKINSGDPLTATEAPSVALAGAALPSPALDGGARFLAGLSK